MYIACHVCKKKSLVIMLTVLVATIKNLIVVCSPQFVADFKAAVTCGLTLSMCVFVQARACARVCVCIENGWQ